MAIFQILYSDVVSYLLPNEMCGVFNETKRKIHHSRLQSSVTKYTLYVIITKLLIIITTPLPKLRHKIFPKFHLVLTMLFTTFTLTFGINGEKRPWLPLKRKKKDV